MPDAENSAPEQRKDKDGSPPALGINTDANESYAEGQRDDQQQRTENRRQRWMVWFTGVIAGATLIYAGISAWQLVTINLQLIEQKREADDSGRQLKRELRKLNAFAYEAGVQARAEGKAAAATKSAADTAASALSQRKTASLEQLARLDKSIGAANALANSANKTAQSAASANALNSAQFKMDERPRIAGRVVSEIWNADQLFTPISIKNFGKTPAYDVRIISIVKPYTLESFVPTIFREGDTFRTMIERGHQQESSFPGIEPGEVDMVSQDDGAGGGGLRYYPYDMAYVKSNAWTWVTAGYIAYSDGSGQRYATEFCFYRGAKGLPLFCPGHNEPDIPPSDLPNNLRSPHLGKPPWR